MSGSVWVGISVGASETRILVNHGATTLMKARLCRIPSHPRALQWLLEAIALWQGQPVRAVLSVGHEADECEAALRRDWFPDFGGPLYTIEWMDRARRPTRRDDVGGLGDFRDLKQLQLFDALGPGQ
jgi:hypothetical protein